MDTDYLRDLADLCLRMLHVVAGIAWIGASFYFIRLDLGLAPPKEPKEGVAGEYWGVHGGGFYHSQKYALAPPRLPDQLHWFKWEAYTTWLSGFALLVVLYWLDADTRLVDPTVAVPPPCISPRGSGNESWAQRSEMRPPALAAWLERTCLRPTEASRCAQ